MTIKSKVEDIPEEKLMQSEFIDIEAKRSSAIDEPIIIAGEGD